jgi:predicted ATPase
LHFSTWPPWKIRFCCRERWPQQWGIPSGPREKLDEGGEGSRFRQRHAEYYRALFDRAEAEWESRDTGEWLGAYGPHIGNLRAALDWAFSPEGDSSIGAALTVAAVPLWFQLSLVDECLGRVQQALASLDARPGEDLYRKMRLYGALGWPQMRAIAGVPSGVAAWKTALVIAENLGDVDYQLRALWALWVDSANNAEHQAALALAEKFCALASNTTEPADLNIGDRMRARSLHFLGDQAGAYMYIKRMLDSHVPPANRSHMARFQYDQRMTARITLARVLWVQGSADQALHTIESNVEDALSLGHVLTLSHVLSDGACALALLAGKLPLADRYIKMLHRYTQDHALDVWHTYAEGFRGQFLVQTGDFRVGTGLLRAAIDKFDATGFVLFRVPFLGSLAEGLLGDGQLTQAEQAIERALALCAGNREGWFVPELHRIKGEITLKANAPDSVWRAEASFLSALDLAREHKALSWELRAATGLARSWQSHGRARDARDLLAPIYTRFTEGVDTADLVAAAALLQQSPPSSNDGSPV